MKLVIGLGIAAICVLLAFWTLCMAKAADYDYPHYHPDEEGDEDGSEEADSVSNV